MLLLESEKMHSFKKLHSNKSHIKNKEAYEKTMASLDFTLQLPVQLCNYSINKNQSISSETTNIPKMTCYSCNKKELLH